MSVKNYEVGALLTPNKRNVRRDFQDALTVILTEKHSDLTVRKLKSFYKKQTGVDWDAYEDDYNWIWKCGNYNRDRSSHKSSVMPVVSTKSEDKPNPIYQVAVLHQLVNGGSKQHTIVYHNTVGLEKALGSLGLLPIGSTKGETVDENERLLYLIRSSLTLLPLYTELVREKFSIPAGFTTEFDKQQFPWPYAYVVGNNGRSYYNLIGSLEDHTEEQLQEKQEKLRKDLALIQERFRHNDKLVGNDRGFEAVVPPVYRLEGWQQDCKEWVMDNLLRDDERIDRSPRYTTPTNNGLQEWQRLFRGENRETDSLNNVWPCFIEVARAVITTRPELLAQVREADFSSSPIKWTDLTRLSRLPFGEIMENVRDEVDCLRSNIINGSWITGYKHGDNVGGYGWNDNVSLLSRLLTRLLSSEELCAALLTLPTPKDALQIIWDPSTNSDPRDCCEVFFFSKACALVGANGYSSWERMLRRVNRNRSTPPTLNELDWD